jgi:hypothetical protein
MEEGMHELFLMHGLLIQHATVITFALVSWWWAPWEAAYE